MDPNLTRSQAHKVFGDLYRKERPPELKAEIDKIVAGTSDIFVRIKKIEELDARASRSSGSGGGGGSAGGQNRSGGRRPSGGPSGGGNNRSASAGSSPKIPGVAKQQPVSKPNALALYLTKVIGGEVAAWGAENGTLNTSMLGFSVTLSDRVVNAFRGLNEQHIVSAIKCYRSVLKFGWERWSPATYNTVIASYQFFNEFVKMPSVLARGEPPSAVVTLTLKLQKYYAMMIKYPNYKSILTKDLPALAEKSDELFPHVTNLRIAMDYITSLDNRSPSLVECFLAFYALDARKIYSWDDICRQLDVQEPVLDAYRAPEAVLGVINGKMKKLKETIRLKEGEIREIEEIRTRYYKFDESGRLVTAFLYPIAEEVLRRSYQEKMVNDGFIKKYISEPQRLLWLILKDFDLNGSVLLGGGVTVKEGGGSREVIVFRQGLFKPYLDEVELCLRGMDAFLKKHSDFEYSFKNLKEDITSKDIKDTALLSFIQLVLKTNKVFRTISLHLKTVADNHRMAAEGKGTGTDKMARTVELPIETFDIGMRYIAHYDKIIAGSTRLNSRTVHQAVEELLMNLYNYLYIFRDQDVLQTLVSSSGARAEIQSMKAELERLGESAG